MFSKKFFSIIIGCFIIGLFVVAVFQWRPVEVNIIGTDVGSNTEEIREIGSRKSLFLLSESDMASQIEEAVSRVRVNKITPGYFRRVLTIEVENRMPISCIVTPNGIVFFDISGNLFSLSESMQSEYICKIVFSEPISAKNLSEIPPLEAVMWYYNDLDADFTVTDKIEANYLGIIISLPIVRSPAEAAEKVDLLQKVIQKYTIEGRRIERIDMRFSDPVVKIY